MQGEDFVLYGGGWGSHQSPDRYSPSSRTPGRGRGNLDTKLVDLIRDNLNRLDVDPGTVARGLSLIPNAIQANLGEIIMLLLGAWADRAGRYEDHPQEALFQQARKMIDSISTVR